MLVMLSHEVRRKKGVRFIKKIKIKKHSKFSKLYEVTLYAGDTKYSLCRDWQQRKVPYDYTYNIQRRSRF